MTNRWLGFSLCTIVAASLAAGTARAQEEVGTVEVTETMDDSSSSSGGSSTVPHSMWAAGGFNILAGEGTSLFGLRGEFGIPLPVDGLSIVASFNWAGRNGLHLIGITPGIAYEYVFDKDFPGALGFVGQADIGVGIAAGGGDARGAALIRFTAAARYYLDAIPGFFVSLQPLGFSIYARNGALTFYDFLTGAGFKFGS